MGNYLDARYIDIHKESASPDQRDVIKKKVFILDVTSHKKCTIFPQLLKICNNVNYIEGRPFPPFLPPSFIFFLCHTSKQICIVMPLPFPQILSLVLEEKNVNVSPPHHTTSSPPLSIFFNDCKQNKASLLCTNKIIIRVCQLLCPLPCICLFLMMTHCDTKVGSKNYLCLKVLTIKC